MTRILDVYLHQQLVGKLVQDDHGQMQFSYNSGWLSNENAVPLSHSMPLQEEPFTRNECRGFFSGILPEEDKREMVAKNLGISARNDFAMLEQIGGECAGAITFLLEGETLPTRQPDYRPLSNEDLAGVLEILPRRPLMAGEDGIRLSLAGSQDKIAVHVKDGTISIPLGGAPSTHILKPAIERFAGTVHNEAYCMTLAAAIDLPVAAVSTHKVSSIEYLLVERYDRSHDEAGNVERVHQEDFCQALGIPSDMKYQSEGGVGLPQSFLLLRTVSSMPVIDLQRFLDAVIFNVLVGNNDAHGKNFSLLYQAGKVRMAPLYDVLCTAYYPELSSKMAMKVGGEYNAEMLFARHFERLANDAGLGKALVKKRVVEIADSVLEALDSMETPHDTIADLPEFIAKRCGTIKEQQN
ncbi:MAG: type II toxin-antitoxin system HipA family toxin [Alphaproteobacteria bacterium]|nr:type II toxin-antitoxin system HipA family toxin [Alphaproteobacteria bacterium]